ncbi:tRNA(Arg) A34 adenosine deaminase TadA [Tamaricihabitans halophyticus]|uniref:tRNA(Arg) A34 adenosine deaminase TadA n=1 Tax=Tamaricihabitans halophyticus TaxID=1262583 RepID=A0A4R2QA65_9PSEU|nr:nucleoside deaminase [Tamaricihabitans halophyticus]TCP45074.1 tRNA(Arg) A34 adenosine deaminase TadA [Tamaricihabitans halophyticus]
MTTTHDPAVVDDQDRDFLHLCVDLAREAVENGDQPFGSLLVDATGAIRYRERNRVNTGDATRHPEFEIARFAAASLPADERASCVVYTSGEHCPMCSAAHAMAGLGSIVFASSSEQLRGWRREWGFRDPGPLAPLGISAVAPGIPVAGPEPSLCGEIRALHARTLGISDTAD